MKFQIGNKYALGYKHTDEAKKKIIEALRGRKCSKETRIKIGLANSISLKGNKPSDSCRKKLSMALIGNKRCVGRVPWNKGNELSDNYRKKLSESHIGIQADEKHPNWKCDEVKYQGLHSWIRKKLGKAKKCSDCGKERIGKSMHWSNVDHKYRRNVNDFKERCAACHTKYDIANNLRKRR